MEQYKNYVVFEDETGESLAIWENMVKKCEFAGMHGNVKEVERGTIIKPESEKDNRLYWLGALFNKKHEYISKRKAI